MKKVVWVVVALLVVAGVGFVWQKNRKKSEPKFYTATAERGPIRRLISATGTVNPVTKVQVGTQVSGTIAKINVDYNSSVREGQVLAQIDPALFQAQVAQASANVERIEAELRNSKRSLERAKELREKSAISEAEEDAALASYESYVAQLSQAKAQLKLARTNLAYTTIHSPIDGIVIARSVDVGQTVAASLSAPQLFVIANDLTKMQVETQIDEADIGEIREGQSATFTVDAFPNRTFEGTVSQVRSDPIVAQNVVTYTTVISVSDPGGRLKPGMTANVSILVDERADALKIPNAALRFTPPEKLLPKEKASKKQGDGQSAFAAPGGNEAGGTAAGGAATDGHAAGGEGARAGRTKTGAHAGGGTGEGAGSGAALHVMKRMQTVWILEGTKTLRSVQVRTGLTDGTSTEVLEGEIPEGTTIVTGVEMASGGSASQATTNPFQPQRPPGMGGGRRSGR